MRISATSIPGFTTLAAATLGAVLGYQTAGVGGAILYAAIVGTAGWLSGRLLARTLRLLGISWRTLALTGAVLGAAALTWNVYL